MNFSANLFIISSPSGAGKSTLVNRLFRDLGETHPMKFSISHTTRGMRPGETDGVEYFFTDVPSFQKMIEENAFLEWAKVFDNYYGTSRLAVEESLRDGTDVFLDIDWQGARLIRKQCWKPHARRLRSICPVLIRFEAMPCGKGQKRNNSL